MLERVLDKGIVIAGDIKIKLVDIELLTIQIRLMIASVDKAKEMGMDWWTRATPLSSQSQKLDQEHHDQIQYAQRRVAQVGSRLCPHEASLPEATGRQPRARRDRWIPLLLLRRRLA